MTHKPHPKQNPETPSTPPGLIDVKLPAYIVEGCHEVSFALDISGYAATDKPHWFPTFSPWRYEQYCDTCKGVLKLMHVPAQFCPFCGTVLDPYEHKERHEKAHVATEAMS